MATPAVVFDGVWKKYRRGQRHDSLRDLIPWILSAAIRRRGAGVLDREEFWALRDISFRVGPGDALGLIGPNGAGKSTILKLLTRIIKPTLGGSRVTGRVGALIELAAGFHPDLTGRENVDLQGALMGMKRADISRKFDEIIEFSGLEDFIDTPVKRYSSGMNARLGFSIAAHLDPDVLIIDEVLAVGDFSFQNRAFDRIKAIARAGTPVVVVSHQLDRVAALCTRAILLDKGSMIHEGTPGECIGEYVKSRKTLDPAEAADCPVRITSAVLRSTARPSSGESVVLEISGVVLNAAPRSVEGVSVRVRSSQTGQILFATSTARLGVDLPDDGAFSLRVELQMNVPAASYWIETSVWDGRLEQDRSVGPAVQVDVADGPSFWGTVQLNPTVTLIDAPMVVVPTTT